MTSGPIQPYLSPSGFSTKTTGATVVPYAVRLPRDPTVDDREYPVGSIWANTVTNSIFGLGGIVSGQARWAPLGDHPLGDVRELTGDTGGAIPPTAHNINIVGGLSSGITVDGNAGTSTLVINSASIYVEGTATTTDGATFVDILTIPVSDNNTLVFDGRLAGWTGDAGGGGATQLVKMGAYRAGAGAIQVGAEDVTLDKQGSVGPENSTASSQVGVSINDVVLRVRGVAGATINWKVQGFYTTVGI